MRGSTVYSLPRSIVLYSVLRGTNAFPEKQNPCPPPGSVAGRVETMLIEAGRVIPGRVDPTVGDIDFDDLTKPEIDDVLDDLAEMTLGRGGDVVIVPAERMPTRTGVAAICRF